LHEDETYEFDMRIAQAQPMKAYEPGKCLECMAPMQSHLKRWQQMQQPQDLSAELIDSGGAATHLRFVAIPRQKTLRCSGLC
jgi:hypothetical protein